MEKGRFSGWYFKHQKANNTIAFIPGCCASGAFVQMLSPDGAQYFRVPYISVKGDRISAGNCEFSSKGCKIDLPGISGEIIYKSLTPLASDIMGPFRYFSMKCRHGVISMAHMLYGNLTVNGTVHCFDGGNGYIEKDSGISFPTSYQWLQCNDFSEPCSIMISIARVPFFAFDFTGCICAVIYRENEYRFATYKGVKILSANENQIHLSQGNLELQAKISSADFGHSLKAPVVGQMTDTIKERINAKISVKMRYCGKMLFNLYSPYATYEYVEQKK